VKWYRKAADQGIALAQFNLGVKYYKGEGVPQDDTEAVKWYRKAAEQGYAKAQFNLGGAYGLGKGVPEDYALAYFWFSLSASTQTGNDYELSVKFRDDMAKFLTPDQIMKAQQMAREWEAKHPRK
jgi:hypothetical protein